ncbi:patatin-like phospholipase family protein [Massilia glaciei]|uniref:Patatin-like phospholipase family protein n=1 Tax=Massilia glaciei TaxID=1524097 RepID=A0A2U2HGR7_9BURK|nr:patatin-like phospholipase family protein [Massilia glaciei]PWF44372.1 patatin-like phospholipase family protein [Massilia glaciei]
MVMAGGGFRFSYYLGMYAAAVESGKAPDVLLASCGGSIAAAVIAALPDDAQRKKWVSSPEMYAFMCGLRSTPKAAIGRSFAHAIKRHLSSGRAARIPDLFDDYFFDIPAQLPLPPRQGDSEVALAIVGGKILFSPDEVGQLRGGRKLFAETVFTDPRSAALLDGAVAPLSVPEWGDNAIEAPLRLDVAMPVADAVRISISDMYYFRCHTHSSGHYMGGVIDLFPIELAHRLADSVTIEMKSQFNRALAIPALRTVLGIDGNARLRHIHAQHADVWVDTSDVERVLSTRGMQKLLSWRHNRIRLVMPGSHATYVEHIDAQWQYGYARGIEAFGQPGSNQQSHMRNANKYNRVGF